MLLPHLAKLFTVAVLHSLHLLMEFVYVLLSVCYKLTVEVSLLNDIIRKAKRWFPMLDARLQMEDLCRKIGFTVEQIGVLLTGKAVNISGSLYSEEYRRKFKVENAEIKVFADSTKPNQLFLYINRQPIGDWFKEQWDNLKLCLSSQRKGVRL